MQGLLTYCQCKAATTCPCGSLLLPLDKVLGTFGRQVVKVEACKSEEKSYGRTMLLRLIPVGLFLALALTLTSASAFCKISENIPPS